MKLKRLTKQKKIINEICEKSDVALTPKEIYIEAKKEIESINLATVYRNLGQLVKNKKLTKVKNTLKGTLYEISGKSPHHYFFCKVCDTTFEKPGCGLKTCIEELKNQPNNGFIVQSHEVYLHGICASCAK